MKGKVVEMLVYAIRSHFMCRRKHGKKEIKCNKLKCKSMLHDETRNRRCIESERT